MIKKLLAVLCIAPAVMLGNDYSEYSRIMSDSGVGLTMWTMASGSPVVKKLDINFDSKQIKKAALEYEILLPPVEPRRKIKITSDSYKWKKILVTVNKKVIFNDTPGKLILQGTHTIDFPAEYLKKGVNVISFGWDKKDNSGAYGYIYMAVDKDTPVKNIPIGKDKKGKVRTRRVVDNEGIRIRLLVNM